MIRLLGGETAREYEAARSIRDAIVREWPEVIDPAVLHQITLVAGAKCYGQRVQDIDVLLLAHFDPPLPYSPFLSFQVGNDLQRPDSVLVRSLCLLFEIKDHPLRSVRFVGKTVKVRYAHGEHDATEQSYQQVHSVRYYLRHHSIHPPYITNLIWLRNVPIADLPTRPHNVLGTPITWSMILNVVGQLFPPRWRDGEWVMDAAYQEPQAIQDTARLFATELAPTRLDRQRMERVNQRTTDLTNVREWVGRKLVLLRGRGGTGKTMRLLQLARQLYDEEGARVLILTYNKALVADIRRLLTFLGISDSLTARSIYVQTVYSLIYEVLQALGMLGQRTNFLEDYAQLKEEAIAFLSAGAVSREDIEQLAQAGHEAFRWDYLFVDEGQDWPDNERDLLFHIYSPTRFIVADGLDQLIRSRRPADWRVGLKAGGSKMFPLKKCLRMKAGLTRFVSSVAHHLGLSYTDWLPNEDLPGGRVIIVDGLYLDDRELHERLLQDNEADGNQPVDMLFCVPPSLVHSDLDGGGIRSRAAEVFAAWGYKVWDGAAEDVRASYPTKVEQLRIVQYDSCRGLEGWIVVLLGLDRFYDWKHYLAKQQLVAQGDTLPPGIFPDDTRAAHLETARWLMIPLTRAMDTLVIQLDPDNPDSSIRAILRQVADEHRDFVQWLAG